jgi:hypothetical protein
MLNDDLNRRSDLNTGTGLNRRNDMGSMMIAALVAAVVIIGLFMWAPWNRNRTADNASPNTTVGSSTSRPAAPASPSTNSPATPAAPSTTK